MRTPHCAVVGAGINGLCTAFWLRRAGLDVEVVEQFGAGHDRGSSHGETRITRSSYHDAAFVALAAAAEREAWPVLEREFARPCRIRTPGLFFGPPDGPFGDYLRATLSSGAAVEHVAVPDARRRFPLLRIDADDAVLVDHTAAVVLASETMTNLRQWLHAHGVPLRWNTPVVDLAQADGAWRLTTPAGELRARTVVLATGAWSSRLHPFRATLTVLRQQVGYFDLDAPAEACVAPAFPVWARIGREPNDFQYGLPSHAGAGTKAATHRTVGAGDDPDAAPPPADVEALRQLGRERFAVPVRSLRATERCLYTMTADQRFHVGPSPDAPTCVTITACSGHAFKFAPVIGLEAADAVRAALAANR